MNLFEMGLEDLPPQLMPASGSRKRKRVTDKIPTTLSGKVTKTSLNEATSSPTTDKKGKRPKDSRAVKEKRLRRFRSKAPYSYNEKLHRACTQRMYVIDRSRNEDALVETIQMAGTTGNIYTVEIGLVPTCSCPDSSKGNQCKHIIYVLHNVLKAPADLEYQLAFLSHELQEIFAAAPPPSSALAAASGSNDSDSKSTRKAIEGSCPICFMDFEPETEEIVYCKAACGNNVHQTCFEQWAKSQSGKEVRCVYCRAPWQGDEEAIKRIVKDKKVVNKEGYVNIAGELGLSGARDYSTYHPHWGQRQFGGRRY